MSRLRMMLGDRFSQNVLWNVASLGVAGVCGVGINYLVGATYGAEALGVFNQVFAAYLVFAQLAVFGVHSSALTHIASAKELAERRAIVTSAILVTAAQALLMGCVFLALADPFARYYASPAVADGIVYATPGLVCFALNKTVLACLNGLSRLRWYAVFQAGRVVLMAVGLGICLAIGAKMAALPVILSVGEVSTFVLSVGTLAGELGRTRRAELRRWAGVHLRFGTRGFLSGLFSELSARTDVVILGHFASDALVGAYSLAALVAEGVFQVLIALRINYAPVVVRLLVEGNHAELTRVIRKARARTYLASVAFGLVVVASYALFVPLTTTDPELGRSWVYFAILMAGMVSSAGYVPFNQLLLWGHRPGWHTVMIFLIVASGALANIALIPVLGAVGAAIATAATYAGTVVLLKLFVKRTIGVSI